MDINFLDPGGRGSMTSLKIDYTEVMIGLETKISLAAGQDIAHYRDKLFQADGARARLGAGWPGRLGDSGLSALRQSASSPGPGTLGPSPV